MSRVATIVGTSIAIFTFLLFFLYPRYSSGEIDPILFQITLVVIGLAIFSLVFAGLYFYTLLLPWSPSHRDALAARRTGDLFWLLGYTVLLLEPSLILFTVKLPVVAVAWLAMWVAYLYLTLHEYRKATRAGIR